MAISTLATTSPTNGAAPLTTERESAFFGLLQAYHEITRGIEQALIARHGLSFTAFEVLNRLARADDCSLRMTDLAEQTPVSISRISRVIDELSARGLAERVTCASDKRVSYGRLTRSGRALIAQAQKTFHETVNERYFGRLEQHEIELLGDVFGRLASGGADCKTALT